MANDAKKLQGKITEIRSNFKRSGNHDHVNQYLAWMSFTNDDVILYSKISHPDGVMNQLERAILEEIQIDTCDLVNKDKHLQTIITAQNNKKRHSEQRSNNRVKKTGH